MPAPGPRPRQGHRPVAVVSFAQADNLRRESDQQRGRDADAGLRRGLRANGSAGSPRTTSTSSARAPPTTWSAGRSASSSALDAIGVWPPRSESHVEMDAAWALYEAWVALQDEEVDTALVYGFGKSSLGDLGKILALQLDPYVMAPLWPDPVSLGRPAGPGPDRRRQGDRGRLRRGGRPQPEARPWPTRRPRWPTTGRSSRAAGRGLRGVPVAHATPCRRSPTGRRRWCWPPGTRPSSGPSGRPGSPASTIGWRPTRSGPATSRRSPSTAKAGQMAGVRPGPIDVAELHAPFAHQELILAEALGLADGRRTSTRRAGRWPPTPSCPAG